MAQTLEAPSPASDAPRRMTIEEYDRIPDDAFGDDRVELIEGLIYTKVGQNLPHIAAVRRLTEALRTVFGRGFNVSGQLPIGLGDASKPEPDALVLRGHVEDYDARYPDPVSEIVVLVEVSDTTLDRDEGLKARLYARHGVPEYWIVNLRDRTLEIRRGPTSEGYSETLVLREGDAVAVGGGTIAVVDVLPKA